jgi:hypothetical protein
MIKRKVMRLDIEKGVKNGNRGNHTPLAARIRGICRQVVDNTIWL